MAFTRLLPILIAAIPACAFLVLNFATPRFADDYCRSAVSLDIPLILSLAIDEYLNWTGRLPVIFLSRVFFSLGDLGIAVFNLTNALVLFLIARMLEEICVHEQRDEKLGSQYRNRNTEAAATFVFHTTFYALLWFTLVRFGEVTLWKTGAIQYLWGCGLAIFALKPVINIVANENISEPIHPTFAKSTIYFIFCFIGGAWLENLSAGVALVWLCCLIYNTKILRRGFPKHLVFGLTSWVAGTIVLVAAPGNYARSDSLGDTTSILNMLSFVLERGYFFLSSEWIVLAILFSGCLYFLKPPHIKSHLTTAIIFIGLGAFTVLAMSAAPIQSFVSRAAFPFEFFVICALLALLPSYMLTQATKLSWGAQKYGAFGILVLATVTLVGLITNYAVVLNEYRAVSQQSKWRAEIMAASRTDNNLETVALPALFFNEERNTEQGTVNVGVYFSRDITVQPDHWRNQCFAKAHGVTAVALAPWRER